MWLSVKITNPLSSVCSNFFFLLVGEQEVLNLHGLLKCLILTHKTAATLYEKNCKAKSYWRAFLGQQYFDLLVVRFKGQNQENAGHLAGGARPARAHMTAADRKTLKKKGEGLGSCPLFFLYCNI